MLVWFSRYSLFFNSMILFQCKVRWFLFEFDKHSANDIADLIWKKVSYYWKIFTCLSVDDDMMLHVCPSENLSLIMCEKLFMPSGQIITSGPFANVNLTYNSDQYKLQCSYLVHIILKQADDLKVDQLVTLTPDDLVEGKVFHKCVDSI